MEKDDFSKDDLLGRLIQESPLDSPSGDFVDRVMKNIRVTQEIAPVEKPLFRYLKAAAPYGLLILVFIIVFFTSDLPFLKWLPGKTYYMDNLVPYFGTLFAAIKNAFSSRYVSFGMLIVTSTGLLYLVDRLFSRKSSV